jgi:subtilisin-like proprotein convertase family protein
MKGALRILAVLVVLYGAGLLVLRSNSRMPAAPNQRGPNGSTAALGLPGEGTLGQIEGPIVGEAVTPDISPAVRDLPPFERPPLELEREINPRQNPNSLLQGNVDNIVGPPDPLLGLSENDGRTPGITLSFDGISFATGGTGSPPDTVGAVGPNHYFQSVNGSFQIFNKSGTTLTGPTLNNAIWAGFGGSCQTRNDGDPVVLYDGLADRWLMSQFTTASPYMICVAISTTPDPTGTYYRYAFNIGSELADYFKFGVWPNAYYMSANESTYTAYAFNRANMLTGAAATFVKFTGQTNFLLPADVDGTTPPAANAPGIFYTFKDNSYAGHGGGVDRLEVFNLAPNFVTPASSTFTLVATIPITNYTYTVCGFFILDCVPQSGAAANARLDALSEWPMFRFPYRNFGTHESLVGNFAIDVGSDRAGIRWFELRRSGGAWTLYQEGTHAPADGLHRFVGSIAQDKLGNIALAYSVSSSGIFPGIRYATRLTTDTLGTLQTEATMLNGGGSQTSTHSRWGDYSALDVDPGDDCTFWFTTEYFAASGSSWRTRIGTFTIPECQTPDFTVTPADTILEVCDPGNDVTAVTVSPLFGYSGSVTLSTLSLPAGASSNFSTNPVSPPGNSNMTLSTAGTAVGSYPFTLRGTDGSITHDNTLTLTVNTAVPGTPTLTAPADGSLNVATTPTFSWTAAAQASSYLIEIATDPAFANIVQSATVGGTSHTPGTLLTGDTVYYWRVRAAANACGAGANSAVFAFRTNANVCTTYSSTDVPKNISSGGTPSVSSVLNVPSGGTISDVNVVGLVGTHSWINDVDFNLTSPAATAVQIMAQSCGNQDNFNLNLDDEAAGLPGGWPCPPTGGGTYRPSNPLSAFDGQSSTGTWTLRIDDNANQDGGSLTGWGLQICTSGTTAAADYSDLSSNFGVAWHNGSGALRLGTSWTADSSFTADGDDASDDGVLRGGTWAAGANVSLSVTVNGGDGNDFLACWFDWNENGLLENPAEKTVAQLVNNGSNTVNLTIPVSFNESGVLDTRCRLYETEPTGIASTETPNGSTGDGEVEDYRWTFSPTAVTLQQADTNAVGRPVAWAVAPLLLVTLVGLLWRRRRGATV